jgi:hypothetical protein
MRLVGPHWPPIPGMLRLNRKTISMRTRRFILLAVLAAALSLPDRLYAG